MIDEQLLDEILPIKDIEQLKDEKIAELQAAGFVITNFHPGGVWYTLLMIVLRIKIELMQLLRLVLNNMYLTHAGGSWLDLKASDYSKKRKPSQKTRGNVTITRALQGDALQISKGHVFKTTKDINGEELRFFALENVTLQSDALSVDIAVEAEKEGSRYNVPSGQITRSLIHIASDITITNGTNWLKREGSDTEDDESLRRRSLRSWADLAKMPVRDTYTNTCEQVPGVLFARVNDQHPRGQGTIDIIITGTAGAASAELLQAVGASCEQVRAPYDDLLIKSAETVTQAITLTVTVLAGIDTTAVSDRVKASIISLMRIQKSRNLNELTHADLIHAIKTDVTPVRNVVIAAPASDISLGIDKVILAGEIMATVQEVAQ